MSFNSSESQTFRLDNFEGPLRLLLYLVQKCEILISDVSLRQLIQQYTSENLNDSADFISNTASLIWLKSKHLLPVRESEETIEEESPFQILPKLLEYCRFKEISKKLESLEYERQSFYLRGVDSFYTPDKKSAGAEKLSLDRVYETFQNLLIKAAKRQGVIQEESWRVKDKITYFRQILQTGDKFPLKNIFSLNYGKEELIVSFLALLELMKLEELIIYKEENNLSFSRNKDVKNH